MKTNKIICRFCLMLIYLACSQNLRASSAVQLSDTIIFDLSQAEISNGLYEIPISLNSNSDIFAFDFESKFDLDLLTFHSFQSLNPSFSLNIFYNANDSTLRGTSFSLNPLPLNQNLAIIRFSFTQEPEISDFSILTAITNGSLAETKLIDTACSGEQYILETPYDDVGNSYLWNTGETNSSIVATTSGTYNLAITLNNNSVVYSPFYKLTFVELPNAEFSPNGNEVICEGESLTLMALENDLIYNWSNGENSMILNINLPGTYSLEVLDPSSGCHSMSVTDLTLEVNALPDSEIAFDGQTERCIDNEAFLSVQFNSDYSYLWNTGAITNEIAVSNSGTFGVLVTNNITLCQSASLPVEISFIALQEDINYNGMVDIFDYLTVLGNFDNPSAEGDFNNNGIVDVFDLLQVLGTLGNTCEI